MTVFQAALGELPLSSPDVGHFTAANLSCESVSVGVDGKCVVVVRDFSVFSPRSPLGFVSFEASADVEFSPDGCQLTPLEGAATSRCVFFYRPLDSGPLTIQAEYQGDPAMHRVAMGETDVIVESASNSQ